MFTEGGLQVCHLLEVVDETWTHLTLQWVSPKEIRYHLILTDQSISEREVEREKKERKMQSKEMAVNHRCSSPARLYKLSKMFHSFALLGKTTWGCTTGGTQTTD